MNGPPAFRRGHRLHPLPTLPPPMQLPTCPSDTAADRQYQNFSEKVSFIWTMYNNAHKLLMHCAYLCYALQLWFCDNLTPPFHLLPQIAKLSL